MNRLAPALTALLGLAVGIPLGVWLERRSRPDGPGAVSENSAKEGRSKGEPAGTQGAPASTDPGVPGAGGSGSSTGPADPPTRPPVTPGPVINDLAGALAGLASKDATERSAAEFWLRKRLLTASMSEWAEMDPRIAEVAAALPLEERARLLKYLYKSEGFLGEDAGPPLLDGSLRRLFFETLSTLPEAEDRDALVRVLSAQLAQEKGAHFVHVTDLRQTTLAGERARLESTSGRPLGDEASAILAAELERFANSDRIDKHDELWELVGFSGASAGAADRAALMKFAAECPQPKPRSVALLAMMTVGPSTEIDEFCARHASDASKPLGERLIAWQRLKKQGCEGLLPASARSDILRLWEESGRDNLADLVEVN